MRPDEVSFACTMNFGSDHIDCLQVAEFDEDGLKAPVQCMRRIS